MTQTTSYGKEHQYFLQSMMCRKILDAAEVKQLFSTCIRIRTADGECSQDRSNELGGFVQAINGQIVTFGMEIKKVVSENTGKPFYALVSCQENAITKLATSYAKNELEFFRLLVEQVVKSREGSVKKIVAVNLADDLESRMSKTDAYELLRRLQREKWINDHNGLITLTPLSIIELDRYFREQFPQSVEFCKLCQQIVFQGNRCNNCDIKLHRHCLDRVSKNQTNMECPECEVTWSAVATQDASSSSDSGRDGKESSTQRKSKRLKCESNY